MERMNVYDLMRKLVGGERLSRGPEGNEPGSAAGPYPGSSPSSPPAPAGTPAKLTALERALSQLERRKAAHARVRERARAEGPGDENEDWRKAMRRVGRN